MMKKEYLEPTCEVMTLKLNQNLLVASLAVDSEEVENGWADAALNDMILDWE